ncbi:GNAT family N-acetyltransferase [Mucilaginibacter achroorhodeus]|uniref:GNAT family N-acetyltransferase n=1 Tax=Mucilaginibacter achroorhodeus TaxID=2599294 RepID=A0A563U5G7_9SPHI|nr:GNAT family N-acetyltransferase [Mucilaginibacter achroorhodeus]TWR26583.1 GNAT family N-acetyltransferase [Mucilaginibacter achroorhodeus]
MKITLRRVDLNEADLLLNIRQQTFFDAFASKNDPAHMQAYAKEAFTIANTIAELSNPESEIYFALADNEVAGYLKLNFNNAQTEQQGNDALELERIYVLEKFQGQKVGKYLMDYAINKAMETGKKFIWLGVWEHNEKALAFYQSKGFVVFGSHPFKLGADNQLDLLMKKDLI